MQKDGPLQIVRLNETSLSAKLKVDNKPQQALVLCISKLM